MSDTVAKEVEHAACTICAHMPSPGFYTGCMFQDGLDCNGWTCDGRGQLTREVPFALDVEMFRK